LLQAFYTHGCRVGPQGEQLQEFLPLYLSADHFERARPLLKKVVNRMYPQSAFDEGCISLVCAALNTLTVLLADKGVAACFGSVAAYTQLHRLFIALCTEVRGVQELVDERVARFVAGHRSKRDVSSLGDFIPLLLVSRSAGWPAVRGPLVTEGRVTFCCFSFVVGLLD
jgi:hypothetical protein